MKAFRREFLLGSGCLALGRAAHAANFEKLSLMNLFAATNINNQDYKSLVCIFLFGGNDANNTVIPYDDFASYEAARGRAPFFISKADLLTIGAPRQKATFGLPNRTTYNTTGLYSLYTSGKLAFVCNVGTLAYPLDRATYMSRPELRPDQLFSHSNQQTEAQTGTAQGTSQSGWGGRLADRIHSTESFPIQVSVAGVTVFTAASRERPLVVPPTGLLTEALRFDPAKPRPATIAAIDAMLAEDDGTTLRRVNNAIARQAFDTRTLLRDEPTVGPFPNTQLGNQLKQIAKFIALRDTISSGGPIRRQLFFASRGGFDTHANQNNNQGNLLTELSNALLAFDVELARQEVEDQVTTFTMSDFSRTFKIGNQASGTDHAWGSHLMVMGGAVNGGDCYGLYPTLALGGPDDVEGGSNPRGRWLPTSALAQYGTTLSKWYGVPEGELSLIFPTIGRFDGNDLGFMRPA